MEEFELVVAFGKNRLDKNWKNEYATWDQLVELFSDVRRTSETMAEYNKMTPEQKKLIKDGPSFVGGFIQGGRRKNANIQSRTLITLDADFCNEDFLEDTELILDGFNYVVYPTHSFRKSEPKYRIIVPTDREMSPDEYAASSRKLAALIGMKNFDKTTFDVARLMYKPSCSKDFKYEEEFVVASGDFISVDYLLGQYEDWTDFEQWERHPSESNQRRSSKKMEDPTEKHGLIGAFCRSYNIHEVIEKVIPDTYEPTDDENRYTFIGASSVGGLVVYNDLFAFSHHESDPISGREVNAFDLVRIHKFGELDINKSEKTPITKSPSFKAMTDFAMKDKNVMREVAISDFGDMKDVSEEDIDWLAGLERDKEMNVLSNARNLEVILSNGPFAGVLGYDAFRNMEVIRSKLPWRERERLHVPYEAWLGADDRRLSHYINKTFDIRSEGMIKNALTEVVHMNSFHPIKMYLEDLDWDGVKRLERLFIDYLGAEDTHYVREVTKKMFVAAVKRVYEPGCKFDEMLVLVGAQGAGKSSLLAKMGKGWFSDSLKTFDSKEGGEHLQGTWIVEIGELSAMKKAEIEEVKGFLSKRDDRYRVAYDRVVTEFPRKCVFFGTTNNKDFLYDPTGNRRFWPVDVSTDRQVKSHFTELDDLGVDLLWAEALSLYKCGETLLLDKETYDEAQRQQESHFDTDAREGIIAEFLNMDVPKNWNNMDEVDREAYLENPIGGSPREVVCVAEIWVECLGNKLNDLTPWKAKPIADIVRRLPDWEDRQPSKVRFKKYGRQKAFVRVSL